MTVYIAHQELFCGDGSGSDVTIEVRYSYTVSKGYPASSTEPAEDPMPEVKMVEVKLDGKWVESPHVNSILDAVFDPDDLAVWLVARANESEADAADEAADHKRQLQREEAHG